MRLRMKNLVFVQIMSLILIILAITLDAQAQECGTVSPNGKEVPWQAGIYGKPPWNAWKCGATLISNKVVVTAAHYLYAYMSSERQVRASTITVAVGKLTRPWADPVDDTTQKSDVKELHLSPGFKQQGIGAIPYFFDDIAVVIVITPFRFNDYIKPVCIDFDYDFEQAQLEVNNKGKAAGWGDAEENNGNPTQYVKTLYTVDLGTCTSDKATNTFYANSKFFTLAISDKICVDAKKPNSAICNGDSGIGLAFPNKTKGVERYYLRGVLSGPLDAEKVCTIETYYGFTSLRKHESFIRKYWNETVPEVPKQIGNCVLPPYPEHGTYTTNVTNVPNITGGEEFVVVSLTVTCDQGFGVMGSSSVTCYNGFWPENLPTCVLMCQLKPHPSVEYRCLISSNVIGTRDCNLHEPVGTIVSPLCREPDFYSSGNLAFMRCKDDGHWDYTARCSPECGKVTPDGKVLVIGGVTVKRGELPWHAGIYKKTTKPYMQICGGSLISNNHIISAAHCFWAGLQPLPASMFAVAVGKVHRPWNDKVDDPQKSDVKEIYIPTRFKGVSTSYQADIAMVVVETPFQYKPYIRPVCLSFDSNFDRLQLQTTNKGKVAGWGLSAANGKPSPVLQVLEMPYVEVGTCIEQSPADFVAFITSDKICAGVRQNSSALCKGDSGGGLSFPASDRGVERHYLRGVVSSAPSGSDACSTDTYTGFTQILKHVDFIKPFITEL